MNLMVKVTGISITTIIANTNPSSIYTTISHHVVKIGSGNILLLPKIVFKSHINTYVYCRINSY